MCCPLHSTTALTDDLANSGTGRPPTKGPGNCRLNVFVALWPRALERLVAAEVQLLLPGAGAGGDLSLFLGPLAPVTYSCYPHSGLDVSDLSTAPVFTACNSALWFPSGQFPGCQCSSELGVLHTVCGLLMGLNQGYDQQNKESLVSSQATVFCFCECTVCHFPLKSC